MSHECRTAPFLTLGFCHWLGIHRNAHLITIYGYPGTGFMQIIRARTSEFRQSNANRRLLVVFTISPGYLVITHFCF